MSNERRIGVPYAAGASYPVATLTVFTPWWIDRGVTVMLMLKFMKAWSLTSIAEVKTPKSCIAYLLFLYFHIILSQPESQLSAAPNIIKIM